MALYLHKLDIFNRILQKDIYLKVVEKIRNHVVGVENENQADSQYQQGNNSLSEHNQARLAVSSNVEQCFF
jgi:hypothetical protein